MGIIALPSARSRSVSVASRRRLLAAALVAPAMVLILALFLWPLAKLISHSLTTPSLSLRNYTAALSDPTTWRIIRITVVIAFECTIACVVLAYPVAYLMSMCSARTTRLLLLIVLLPFWTSILVRMYAWMIILGTRGVINENLMRVGITHEPIRLLYTRFAVVLGMTHYLLPFMILSLYSAMVHIDRGLLESSSTLGASGWQTFRRIYFPLSAPGVFAGSLLVFILSLGFFVTPALLGGPTDTTMPVFIQQRVSSLQFDEATAIAVILLLIVVVLFLIYERVFGFDRLFNSLGH